MKKDIDKGYVYQTQLKKPKGFKPNKINFYKFVREKFITFEKINWIKYKNNVITVYLVGLYIIEITLI